jgi:prepilin-type processing-associated H-X9-DG protein
VATSLPKTLAFERHTTRANYVFTDGHAASHAFEQTWRQEAGNPPEIDWYDPD